MREWGEEALKTSRWRAASLGLAGKRGLGEEEEKGEKARSFRRPRRSCPLRSEAPAHRLAEPSAVPGAVPAPFLAWAPGPGCHLCHCCLGEVGLGPLWMVVKMIIENFEALKSWLSKTLEPM